MISYSSLLKHKIDQILKTLESTDKSNDSFTLYSLLLGYITPFSKSRDPKQVTHPSGTMAMWITVSPRPSVIPHAHQCRAALILRIWSHSSEEHKSVWTKLFLLLNSPSVICLLGKSIKEWLHFNFK